jgi:hypothetical protein
MLTNFVKILSNLAKILFNFIKIQETCSNFGCFYLLNHFFLGSLALFVSLTRNKQKPHLLIFRKKKVFL